MTADQKNDFQVAVESFPWQSETQKEGYLAFVQFIREFGKIPEGEIDLKMAFIIQKSHESYEWTRDTFGGQISTLQDDIKLLQEENHGHKTDIENLRQIIKGQGIALEGLSREMNNAQTKTDQSVG